MIFAVMSFKALVCLLICLFPARNSFSAGSVEQVSHPNVILLMADDLGWGDVGFHGNDRIRTPHLDAMAAAGMELTRFYTASSICSPTRASVLTGRDPYRMGILSAHTSGLRVGEVTLAEVLASHGYATGFFGKWHLGWVKPEELRPEGHYSPPWHHGFEENFATTSAVPTWDPTITPFDIWSQKEGTPWKGGRPYVHNGREVSDNMEGDDSRIIMDRALPFIRENVRKSQPFLAVIWFHTPHAPVVAGPEYLAMYEDLPNEAQRHYFGAITAMDEQIGRLRNELKALGVAENTILFFTSDNGPSGPAVESGAASAGPLRKHKHWHYDGGIRVPSLAEWPGTIPAAKSDRFAGTVDYFPTILELTGLSGQQLLKDRPMDGMSFADALLGRPAEREGFLISGYRRLHRGLDPVALIESPWKLIRPRKKETFELYHLLDDPAEKHDVLEQNPEVAERLQRKLELWSESTLGSRDGADFDF